MAIDYDEIDDYLANRLGEERAEAFELRLLEEPALQDALENQRDLKEGLTNLPEHYFSTSSSKKKSWLAFPTNVITSPPWAYAATVFLAISLSFQWLATDNGVDTHIDRIVPVDAVRTTDQRVFELSANEVNLLEIDIDPGTKGPYAVTISNKNDRILQQFTVDKAVEYSLKIIPPKLPLGIYDLTIEAEDFKTQFSFEVVK